MAEDKLAELRELCRSTEVIQPLYEAEGTDLPRGLFCFEISPSVPSARVLRGQSQQKLALHILKSDKLI